MGTTINSLIRSNLLLVVRPKSLRCQTNYTHRIEVRFQIKYRGILLCVWERITNCSTQQGLVYCLPVPEKKTQTSITSKGHIVRGHTVPQNYVKESENEKKGSSQCGL